ncbi:MULTISPECIES: hypothetical protein [Clostridium]|uniref:hypothetical protein n=1 Tax=Clostridium TaxID=1485 RepID=UPI000C076D5F|nr:MULTISPECIES: hypothetical protein [Clostridium]MDU4728187.1 hypothetical protein [Clostridium sp.]
MNYEKVKKIVNKIVENEFEVINQYEEMNFINNDINSKIEYKIINNLYELAKKEMTERDIKLLEELDTRRDLFQINLCKFYFIKGLISGLSNLKFLSEIENVDHLIKYINLD